MVNCITKLLIYAILKAENCLFAFLNRRLKNFWNLPNRLQAFRLMTGGMRLKQKKMFSIFWKCIGLQCFRLSLRFMK